MLRPSPHCRLILAGKLSKLRQQLVDCQGKTDRLTQLAPRVRRRPKQLRCPACVEHLLPNFIELVWVAESVWVCVKLPMHLDSQPLLNHLARALDEVAHLSGAGGGRIHRSGGW